MNEQAMSQIDNAIDEISEITPEQREYAQKKNAQIDAIV
jgi:hypothetical protein